MQKSRPLGVTILAYWALAGSGALFVSHAFFLAGYRFTDDAFVILGPLGSISAPLGSGSMNFLPANLGVASYSYVALVLAAFFAIVGLHTFKGRRWVWFANVGMSMAALAQFGVSLTSLALYTGASTIMLMQAPLIAVSLLRLYYLFRPNVRDFFDTWSIFAQKRTV